MLFNILAVHEGLFTSSRLPSLAHPGRRVAGIEVAVLISMGIGAGLMSLLPDFHLRIPGNAILRSVFPMALGLALVPRQLGGSIMGASALATAFSLKAAGFGGFGAGAMTSLGLAGPLLDIALLWAGRNWQLYLAIVLSGLGSNLIALLVRGGLKALTFDGTRPLEDWWMQAIITYPVCGILAGLMSAFVWFQLRGPRKAGTFEHVEAEE